MATLPIPEWEANALKDLDSVNTFVLSQTDKRDVVMLTYHPVSPSMTRDIFLSEIHKLFRVKKRTVSHFVGVEEGGEGTTVHYHMVLQLGSKISISSMKKWFNDKGMNVDVTHGASYEVYFDYVYTPSVKKPMTEMDSAPFISLNHPTIPLSVTKKREKIIRLDFGSFYSIVSQNGLFSAESFLKWAATLPDNDKGTLASFLAKRQKDLQYDLDLVKSIHTGQMPDCDEVPDRLQALGNYKLLPCTCGKNLESQNNFILSHNNICRRDFCNDLLVSLVLGAGKHQNLCIIGRSGAGKTSIVSSLEQIFGPNHIFSTPISGTSMPLLNLRHCNLCLMNDFRWNSRSRVSWYDLLIWFEGLPFKIGMPRNISGSDYLYTRKAPVIITSAEELVFDGPFAVRETEMMKNRLNYYRFNNPIPSSDNSTEYKKCGRCFMSWLLKYSTRGDLKSTIPPTVLPPQKPANLPRSLWKALKREKSKKN